MIDGWTIVVDVGKTHTKVSLWDAQGRQVDRSERVNVARAAERYRALDVEGIESWLLDALAGCARKGTVKRIIPVAHGAAAALIRGGRLLYPPMDYEQPIDEAERIAYLRQRDSFEESGSPFLPDGLNLGMQLHLIESLEGPLPADVTIVPWPQYWAWRLCGVAAAEVTSLGCHSDLWRPVARGFTDLARRRGWAARMAPLRSARDVLGTVLPGIAEATGLRPDCEVVCGLHDSNAALLAARGHAEIVAADATVLSTGTWFVAMRTPAGAEPFDAGRFSEQRDCLINVDVDGLAIPSARFMGGRDADFIQRANRDAATGGLEPVDTASLAAEPVAALLPRLGRLMAQGIRLDPSFVPGVGPYPDLAGVLEELPDDPRDRRVAAALYLALMTNTVLDLIGSKDRLLVEGRFAGDALLVGLLATLRPDQQIYTGGSAGDLAYGALRLVAPDLPPPSALERVAPLPVELEPLADDWRSRAEALQMRTAAAAERHLN